MNCEHFPDSRVLVWFSCGAASTVAAKIAIEKYKKRCLIVYCDTSSEEHPDNIRFRGDAEKYLGMKITVIKSDRYTSPTDVFEKCRFISGSFGARCTTELKKIPRKRFSRADDIHIFRFTADEKHRCSRFTENNPEILLDWVLVSDGITKSDCYKILHNAGIVLPAMYLLGYPNNNCMGCVKSTSPGYWNKIRRDFPHIFEKRAEVSRKLGVKLIELRGQRIFLDELPPNEVGRWKDEIISCGPECGEVN